MKRIKVILGVLLILSTLLPTFSSCGECEHVWDNGYIAQEPTDKEVGYRVYTCIECGSARNEEIPKLTHIDHDYSKNQWANDENSHWLVCTFKDCTATTNKGTHILYPSNNGYTCQICMTENNNHTFSNKIDFDQECHWIACDDKDCSVIASKLPHTLDSESKCTACGFSTSSHTKHIFSKWQWDENNHWLICNIANCTESTEKTPHTWLDSSDGGKICKDCRLTKQ